MGLFAKREGEWYSVTTWCRKYIGSFVSWIIKLNKNCETKLKYHIQHGMCIKMSEGFQAVLTTVLQFPRNWHVRITATDSFQHSTSHFTCITRLLLSLWPRFWRWNFEVGLRVREMWLTLGGPCIVKYCSNKSQRNAPFLNFILVKNSTCFGQIHCPSSGLLLQYSQQLVFVITVRLTVC